MAFFRKIKAGLVKNNIDDFVGEEGNIFFNVETGEFRLSDGVTPGGISLGSGGGGYTLPTASTTVKGGVKIDGTTIKINNQVISGFSGSYSDLTNKPSLFSGSYNDLTNKPTIPGALTVSLIDATNTVSSPLTNITAIRFDTDSGFDITDLGSGAVKVGMNSTFKTWKVDGQQDLVATGLDTIEFVAGSGLVITTDPLSSPKSITFKTVDKTVTLYQEGDLEPTTGSIRWYNPSDLTITKIIARLSNSSTDTVTIRIKKSNTIVETVNFSANQTKTIKTTNISMTTDDFLTVDVVTTGGSNLSVEFTYNFE